MKHISLFSGIGGFDLAAEWAGWTNVASCEINPFGRKNLEYYWPEAYHHNDIKTLTGSIIEHETQKRYGPDWRADGVILSGGFPCQPYSLAGKRLGKEDERHLWPEMLRVIREVKPDWIVGENVFGLVNWSDGLVFHEVQTDLEAEGYEVQSFVLPACATDAPHRRDRLWIVAKLVKDTVRGGCLCGKSNKEGAKDGQQRNACSGNCNRLCLSERTITNANSNGQHRSNGEHEVNTSKRWEYAQRDIKQGVEHGHSSNAESKHEGYIQKEGWPPFKPGEFYRGTYRTDWQNFPTQSPVCPRNDGFSAGLDGITFPRWRNESIKAAGNAVVPQVVFRIFDTINKYSSIQSSIHNKNKTSDETLRK